MFRITYRKLSGQTAVANIIAVSESIARVLFFRQYDGRIITIEKVA